MRNKNFTAGGTHCRVWAWGSAFPAHTPGRALCTTGQCRKVGMVRIMTNGEEKTVITFTTRLKADREEFIILTVDA